MSSSLVVRVVRKEGTEFLGLPAYATPGSVGLDLRASEKSLIPPGEWVSVGTGLFIEIPEGVEAQIRPRSGLALKYGITVLNAPGTIDADYRGEIRVLLVNFSRDPFQVEVGDRIAQLIFSRVERVEWEEVLQLEGTRRENGGFGSTGMK